MRSIVELVLLLFVLQQMVVDETHCADCSSIDETTGGPWNMGGTNRRRNGKWSFSQPAGNPSSSSIQITYETGISSIGNMWSYQSSRTDNIASSPPTTTLTFNFNWGNPNSDGKYELNFANLDYDSSEGTGGIVSFVLDGTELCTGSTGTGTAATNTTTATTGSGNSENTCSLGHNLNEVLRLSNLFYKAQRSGDLPDNDVPWRKDSFLTVANGLTGGYFDAGDYVKFGFPGAAAITVLAWGMVEFKDGYDHAGLYSKGLETLKWQTDYFLKCKTGANEFYGQCGNGVNDHKSWGRPEDYTLSYPCYKIDANNPGTELAAETAAALAASAMAFASSDATYSSTLLSNAADLYTFAKNHLGNYHNSITDAENFYKSFSGYYDELAWAAAWLYKATNTQSYLTEALSYWKSIPGKTPNEFSWDNKVRGVAVLLSNLASSPAVYKSNAKTFCETTVQGIGKTSRGTVFISQWGSNRHAANVAFLCMVFNKYHSDTASSVKQFGKDQIKSFLGDNTVRSHVVGYGHSPPDRPHHRSSSCPAASVQTDCGWSDYHKSAPNPHVLQGALIGGPDDINTAFQDDRTNHVTNEVALDYNAGFQSALAAIISLHSNNNC